MADYDGRLFAAKQVVIKALCRSPVDPVEIGSAIDDLNKAWDALTDCLVRQVRTRDEQIRRLMNEMSELTKT
jgi:hypothetical protein